MSKVLENVVNGKYNRKELETLIKNATSKGGHEDIIVACQKELSSLKNKPSSGKKGKRSGVVVEERDGYSIMASAYTESGKVRHPDLMPLAKIISLHPFAQDVAIMKT